jgi:hypothetical protein
VFSPCFQSVVFACQVPLPSVSSAFLFGVSGVSGVKCSFRRVVRVNSAFCIQRRSAELSNTTFFESSSCNNPSSFRGSESASSTFERLSWRVKLQRNGQLLRVLYRVRRRRLFTTQIVKLKTRFSKLQRFDRANSASFYEVQQRKSPRRFASLQSLNQFSSVHR